MKSSLKILAYEILKTLSHNNKTLATAESCTGGLIASTITDIPGASKIFLGGVVVYAKEIKQKILGIPEEILKEGVISAQVAEAMAKIIKDIIGSDYSIATTGNLGPSTLEGKPKGLIYIAVADSRSVEIKELNLKGDRIFNKQEATLQALKALLNMLK